MTLTACIAGIGFFMFMVVIRILTRSDLPSGQFVPISFFYFAALFGICFMVLRYGSNKERSPSRALDKDELAPPAYLSPASTAQLEEARDFGIGSVTDATTRTLDEVKMRER